MVPLDGEAAAGAGEQQEQVLAEKLEAVHRTEQAVEEPRVVAEDRLAAELQRAHGGQNLPRAHRRKSAVEDGAERVSAQPPGETRPVLRREAGVVPGCR